MKLGKRQLSTVQFIKQIKNVIQDEVMRELT